MFLKTLNFIVILFYILGVFLLLRQLFLPCGISLSLSHTHTHKYVRTKFLPTTWQLKMDQLCPGHILSLSLFLKVYSSRGIYWSPRRHTFILTLLPTICTSILHINKLTAITSCSILFNFLTAVKHQYVEVITQCSNFSNCIYMTWMHFSFTIV